MLPAIGFDDQLVSMAGEVGEILAKRDLSATASLGKSLAEQSSQQFLGFGGIAPEFARPGCAA
ncbi:hypothetical protein [Sphingomonas sp. G-3-2-10]|uniref:hypothetical protein n=1 Tax=Sphingomonas sp. G-3-2-10 TaxID=2728838 RepID=UPI001F0E9A82|nr:hypothetical protein [Sphingomonas sp. G-3-2-10]